MFNAQRSHHLPAADAIRPRGRSVQQPQYTATFFSAAARPDLAEALFRFRYALFVRELGWSLAAAEDRERDEFDTDDATYCGL